MSTSDPRPPAGEPDPTRPDDKPEARPESSTPETSSGADAGPGAGPEPAGATRTPGASAASLRTTQGAEARAAAAHSRPRPDPVAPPEPGAVPGEPSGAARDAEPDGPAAPAVPPAPVPSAPVPPAPPQHTAPDARTTTPPKTVDVDENEPKPPRTTRFGGHLWGVLIGLLVTPAALTVLLVGQARILSVEVEGWTATVDVLGIVLVTAAVVVLALLLYLGTWTNTAPITGGIIGVAAGAVYLFAPGVARTWSLEWLATEQSRDTVLKATVAGTTGTVFLAGLLLLLGGIAISRARRSGRLVGAYRERTRSS